MQSPTLRLIVDRELERRAFVPVPYWEIKATLTHGDDTIEVAHAKGRFDSLEAMETALARAQADTAEVTAYRAEPRKVAPPAPFNTTALMSAASSGGVSPARAMRAAESLYLDGLISYPRTDNTVYPPSLDLRGSLEALAGWQPVATTAARLARQGKYTPTRGKKRTTDHPPIYPVAVPKKELSGDQAKVYDLVVRRFLATLLPAAVIEGQRVDVRIGQEPFLARGSRVASPGFLEVYEKYAAKRDRPLPALQPGDVLEVRDLRSESKETQPPSRYGQGPLIEKMEELGLGTKATRADIIQHLYDRNYVRDNPVEPTELGVALITAFDAAMKKAPVDISSWQMTAKLDDEMDRISEGELRRDEVVAESQDMLEQAWKLLDGHIADIRERIKSGVREDLTLGECKNCGGQLRVLRGKTGKRFAACVGKEGDVPQPAAEGERPRRGCGQTFPLPQRGTITPTGKTCGECGWPEIKVVGAGGRGRPWVLCVDIDCPSKAKYRARAAPRRRTPEREPAPGRATRETGVSDTERRADHARGLRRLRQEHAGGAALRAPRRLRAAGRAVVRPGRRDPRARRHRGRRGRPRRAPPRSRRRWRPGPRRCCTPRRAPSSSSACCCPSSAPAACSSSTGSSTRRSPIRASPAAWASTPCWPSTSRACAACCPTSRWSSTSIRLVGLARAGGAPDRIEAEGLDFQQRVAAGFAVVARRFPERVRLIDGSPRHRRRGRLRGGRGARGGRRRRPATRRAEERPCSTPSPASRRSRRCSRAPCASRRSSHAYLLSRSRGPGEDGLRARARRGARQRLRRLRRLRRVRACAPRHPPGPARGRARGRPHPRTSRWSR